MIITMTKVAYKNLIAALKKDNKAAGYKAAVAYQNKYARVLGGVSEIKVQ